MAFRAAGTIGQISQAHDDEAVFADLSGEGQYRIRGCSGRL